MFRLFIKNCNVDKNGSVAGLSIQIDNPEVCYEGGIRFLMQVGKYLRA